MWNLVTLWEPPLRKSEVYVHMHHQVHYCNGKRVGPPIGHMGWGAMMEKFPLGELAYPSVSDRSYKGPYLVDSVTNEHGVQLKITLDGPTYPRLETRYVNYDGVQYDISSIGKLMESWAAMVTREQQAHIRAMMEIDSMPMAFSIRGGSNGEPMPLNIEFTSQKSRNPFEMEFSPRQPFCHVTKDFARMELEEYFAKKYAADKSEGDINNDR